MKQYLHILAIHARQSFARLLTYRISAVISTLYALLYLGGSYLSVKVYFADTTTLGGWNQGQVLVLLGAFQLMAAIFDVLFLWAQDSIPVDIMEGQLDLYLLRPANPLFLISTRELYIPGILSLPIPMMMIGAGLHMAGLHPSLMEWVFFALSILLGSLFMFCLTQIVINLSFWIEGYSSLWVVADELMKFGSRPQKMYIPAVRVLFGFILPIITVLNFPADILIGAAEPKNAAIALMAVAGLFAVMLNQWKRGLQRYQSASS